MVQISFFSALLPVFGLVNAAVLTRDIRGALPQNADEIEQRFQPYMDFDTNGCYQTSAIDPAGNVNPGKSLGGAENGQCRDEVQLDNSNTYSRRRCNQGHCAILYEMYYEKDQVSLGPGSAGHPHDWENVVIIARMSDNAILRASFSRHGGYEIRNAGDFQIQDGTHVLAVYHKDGGSTHCHRAAGYLEAPENVKGSWFRCPLVGYNGFPGKLRDVLYNHDFKDASIKAVGARFPDALRKAGAEDFINVDFDEF